MSAQEREAAFYETSLQLLSTKRILKHMTEIPLAGFPMTHLMSVMKQLPMRRAMRRAYAQWQASGN